MGWGGRGSGLAGFEHGLPNVCRSNKMDNMAETNKENSANYQKKLLTRTIKIVTCILCGAYWNGRFMFSVETYPTFPLLNHESYAGVNAAMQIERPPMDSVEKLAVKLRG